MVAFTYDADGNRASKSVTSGGMTTVNDLYQSATWRRDRRRGHHEARYTYDSGGVPTSGQVGNDRRPPPRPLRYNGDGDVVALTTPAGPAWRP